MTETISDYSNYLSCSLSDCVLWSPKTELSDTRNTKNKHDVKETDVVFDEGLHSSRGRLVPTRLRYKDKETVV